MKRGYKILQPETPTGEKFSAAAKAGAHYAAWYPSKYIGWSRFPKFGEFGKLGTHIGFIERSSRHLARSIFHAMIVIRSGSRSFFTSANSICLSRKFRCSL